tara:strand:+ start:186 stop:674 length:489 start_codon:yes stop_codon:yes gene_type:complete
LDTEEEVLPKGLPTLLFPSSNRPASREEGHIVWQCLDEFIGFTQTDGCASKIFARNDRTRNQSDSFEFREVRTLTQTPLIDGDVVIFDAATLKNPADIANMETDIRRDTKSGRFVFVSIDDQPRQEITSAAITTPSTSIVLTTATTATTSVSTSTWFGFLNA